MDRAEGQGNKRKKDCNQEIFALWRNAEKESEQRKIFR